MREMKDSGIEWIGEIPNNWIICRVKNVIESNKDGIKIGPFGSSLTNRIVENGSYKVYAQSNLIRGDFFSTKHTITEDVFFELRSYEVLPGDICLSMMGTIGKCLQVPANIERGIMDSHLIKVRLNPIMLPSFFSYVYDKDNSSVCYTQMKMDSKGSIMDGLNTSIVKNLVLPLPPKDEQQRIIDYLDTKCSEIDALSADIQKEIEALQEYRKSVITEAVTKGLDPNVEMKDSGTCSIGLIPASWTACKALYCLSMPITDGPHTTPELYDDGIPFVSAEAVSCGNGSIDFNHIRGYISKEFYEECCQKYVPQIDDVYMIKSGATTGRVSIVDTNQIFTIWSPLAVFRVNKSKMLARYLFYMLQSKSVLEQVELSWSFGTQQNIGMRVLERLIVTRPKIDEQKQIVAYLNDKCSEIDSIIANKQKQLDILAEYRKSLIYEYVTGKKEVPAC